MPKRKFDDFKDDSLFKFWGIVISRFVWGYSRSEVAKKFDCSESYTTKVMQKFEEDGGYLDHRQFNRAEHLKTKPEVKKVIVKALKKKPNTSSPQIQEAILNKGYDITDRTVRNLRKELGFVQTKASLLPNLSEENLKLRLEYCERHYDDKFSNTIFTDESNFQLAANHQILWYRKHEEQKPHLTKPKNNKKIMIWGGISRKGQTPLHIYRLDEKEKVNAGKYVECLDDNLLDSMDRKYGEGRWRLLQDNARPHVAEETIDYLQENDVKLIDHLPYSPDLNPIEKVWAWMKGEIGQTTYTSVEDLIKVVTKKWNSMTIAFQNDLIDHHMVVIKEVYDADGAYV